MSKSQRRAKKLKAREKKTANKIATKRELHRENRRLSNELAKMKEGARPKIPPIVNEPPSPGVGWPGMD
jgi:hypothetical protein